MSETYTNKDGKLEITIERDPSKEVKSIEQLKAEKEINNQIIARHQAKNELLNKRIAEAGKLGIVEKVEEVIEEPK